MNLMIRTFVVTLVLAGAAASATTPLCSVHNSKGTAPSSRIPVCPPDDPNACGIADPR